ncbi:MAG: EAL domain-containing protein [[Clostridium] scindens]
MVERLRDSGFVVEMDDFGSGYSFNTLSELPIDVLSLDLKFLREETETKRRHATMQAVINLALELGLQVIAEGVETKQQAQRLALMGCQYAQGYYYGHPMPQEEFEEHFMDCCI